MGAKILKSDPYRCKIGKKGTLKRLFLTKFEFYSFQFFENCQNPALMCAKIC